jgi:RNA polymerase sigma-70 factor (ECF subfamily)
VVANADDTLSTLLPRHARAPGAARDGDTGVVMARRPKPYRSGENRLPSPPMDATVDPDAMLMQAYARGDLAAFEALYARHRGTLYRFLLRSVRDPQRTDELFQETWSRVIGARERYQPQAKFSTWLLQIAHNLMVDSYRRQRPVAEGDEAEAALATVATPEREQPDHALSDFERRRGLQRAIEQLPEDQRTVVLLRLEHELSLEEMAEITGVGRETVKSRLRYAMNKLREVLAE